jgi:hypothetical protein
MKTILTAGLSDLQSEEVTREFSQSGVLRERLIDVLNGKKESLRSEVRSKTSYESPSWAYLQADANGYERAISEVISLLSSKK